MECRFLSIKGRQSRQVTISHEIDDWAPFFDISMLTIVMRAKSGCHPSTQENVNLESRAEFALKFAYDLTFSAEGEREIHSLKEDDGLLPFEHHFAVKNRGPSPLHKRHPYSIFVPDSPLIEGVKIIGAGEGACEMRSAGLFSSGLRNSKLVGRIFFDMNL